MKAIVFSLLPLFAVTPALAATAPPGAGLGNPTYSGTGCPAGSASATLSPDASALSILFDQYQVEAGGNTGTSEARKGCDITVPVRVPPGYSASIAQIDFRGFNALPENARGSFSVEYYFSGQQGPRSFQPFFGPLNDDYTLKNALMGQGQIWSACGQSIDLRANTNIYVHTNQFGQQSVSTVDSADVQSALVYTLQWKTCAQPPVSPFPGFPPVLPTGSYCTLVTQGTPPFALYKVVHYNGTVYFNSANYQAAVNHMRMNPRCLRP